MSVLVSADTWQVIGVPRALPQAAVEAPSAR